jgi:hypothetical protein
VIRVLRVLIVVGLVATAMHVAGADETARQILDRQRALDEGERTLDRSPSTADDGRRLAGSSGTVDGGGPLRQEGRRRAADDGVLLVAHERQRHRVSRHHAC